MFFTSFKILALVFSFTTPFQYGKIRASNINNDLNASWYSGGKWNRVDVSFTENGILNILKGTDTVSNAWDYKVSFPCDINSAPNYVKDTFDLSGDNEVVFTFSIGLFDKDGNSLSKSANSSDAFYVTACDSDNNNNVLGRLKVYYASNGALSSKQKYQLKPGSEWPNDSSPFGKNEIKGTATGESEFTIGFSRKYGFRSYVDGTDAFTQLDTTSSEMEKYISSGGYNNVKNVRFEVGGDGGFTTNTEVLLRSINGQSFANGPRVNDNIAPQIVFSDEVKSTLVKGQSYNLPVKAIDPVSSSTLTLSSNDGEINNLTFTPNKIGDAEVKITALDEYNNKREKVVSFNVVAGMEKPTIVSLPEIQGGDVEPFSTLTFDSPTFIDSSGMAKVNLTITKKDDESIKYILNKNSEGKFSLSIGNDFSSGTYVFIYTITNDGGTTVSDPIEAEFNLIIKPTPDYVTSDTNMIIDYVDDGIRVKSDGVYRNASFKHFDLNESVDVTYTIPIYKSNEEKNQFSYLDFKLINESNNGFQIWYRIWIDGKETNDSSPSNVYVFRPGKETIDITNCGWLSRDVDGVDGKFHMAFNFDNYFSGEFREELKAANGVEDVLNEFFKEAPTSLYTVAFSAAGKDTSGSTIVEFVINSLNKQSFKNVDGVISKYRKPVLNVELTNNVFEINKDFNVSYYAKNVLEENTLVTATVYEGDNVVYTNSSSSQNITLNINKTGLFTLTFSIDYGEDKQVKKSFEVEIRSIIQSLDISLNEEYKDSYLPGEKIKVYKATYSNNVDLEKTKITLTYPNLETDEVEVDEEIILEHAGVYALTYYACDNATPNVNETTLTKYIKVLDVENPDINLTITGDLTLDSLVNIRVNVTDDSAYDCYVFITNTDGDRTIYDSTNVNFIASKLGEYKIDVHVEDVYGNVSSKSEIIKIVKPTLSKTTISWIIIGSCLFVLMSGFIAMNIVLKRRGE